MNTTAYFRTWTASSTGEVRHYFNGRITRLLGADVSEFGTIEAINGADVTGRDRSRLANSLRTVKVWVDESGTAHVTGWDPRMAIVTAADVAAAVEAAYAA